eukprot:jgi/Tetstr1/433210/TSEL_022498.t1
MFSRRKKKDAEPAGAAAPPRSVRKLLTPRMARHGGEAVSGHAVTWTPRSLLRPPSAPSQATTGGKTHRGAPTPGAGGQAGRSEQSPTGQTPREALAFDSPESGAATEDVVPNNADNVKVLVRIRPPNQREMQTAYSTYAFRQGRSVILKEPEGYPDTRRYTFDTILGEDSAQEDVFIVAGLPVVENCISGYNSSVFCYGQTGAGKTFTMQGRTSEGHEHSQDAGLMPRVFDHVFKRISEEEDRKGRDNLKYSIKCSFLQIYNEQISDLLRPSSTNLQIREELRHGCYVEGLSEHVVLNGNDMMQLLKRGIENRRVSETRMNRESSRSHSVMTCIIEGRTKSTNGMTSSKYSRLNLIDLAGSERNKLSGAQGEQLKEASNINKSLSTLGRVIMNLVDQQCGKRVHVPYRDSRLTFLLQDSLGGNAKTFMIANVSPSMCCASETLSTLRFAHSAKSIVNKAVVNEEASGDIAELQSVIKQLRGELEMFHEGTADPFVELKQRLESVEAEKSQVQSELDTKLGENKQLQKRVSWLEKQLEVAESNRERYEVVHAGVRTRMVALETQLAEANQVAEAVKAAEVDFLVGRLEEKDKELSRERAGAASIDHERHEVQQELNVTRQKLELEQAAARKLRTERDAAAKQRDELSLHCDKQSADAASLEEALTKAKKKARAAEDLAKSRADELWKVQKTLETVEAVAKGHEQDLLQEIDRLELELSERNEAMERIFRVADNYRTPARPARPHRTPLASTLGGSAQRPSYLQLPSPTGSGAVSTRSRRQSTEMGTMRSPLAPSPAGGTDKGSMLASPTPGRSPLQDATNSVTNGATPPATLPATRTLNGDGSAEFFTPLSESAASAGGLSRLASVQKMTPFDDGYDSDDNAAGSDTTWTDEGDSENEAEEGTDEPETPAPASGRNAGVRISTCNLVYSNPMMPAQSPGSGRRPASPSCEWAEIAAAAAADKENGHQLVRASHVLRRKAASAATPPNSAPTASLGS